MKTKKLTILLQLLVSLLPLTYLLFIWNQLAESVPMHYNIHNQPDRMGSKIELLFLMLFMSSIGFGVGMLMRYLNKIDPKKNIQHNEGLMNKVSWTVVIFISVISCYIVYVSLNYSKTQNSGINGKMIEILICLIFVVLGNFMNNVKPNYFVGIRTPWNLENEENWRKTHHLGSKVMFFGGILMIALILLLPTPLSSYVLLIGLVPVVLIPFVYSYLLFKREKH
jgi:uncharacterized membrane protein